MAFIDALTGGFRGDSVAAYAADGALLGPAPDVVAAPVRPAARRAGVDIITFKNVGKHYVDQTGRKDALRDIDLAIRTGEIFGVIGRSGAGKSTLIRTINRLEHIDEGSLQVDGEQMTTLSHRQLVALRRRVGMIFQHFNLLSSKTVHANVALPLRVAGVSRDATDAKVRRLLDLVGLADKANAYPAQLSGGQKQRVGIARALVHDPGILLCDEATSALDPETTQSILELLKSINAQLGLTIVLITHEMSVVRQVCDRVAVLEAGRIVESGHVWEVFGTPKHPATRALLRPLEEAHRSVHLLKSMTHAPASEASFAVLAIRFEEGLGPPSLASFLTRTSLEGAHLLSAGVSSVQGRTCGQVLLAVPVPHLDQAMQHHAAEVLGYVESPA